MHIYKGLFNPRYISRNLSGIGTRLINNREIPQEIAPKVEYSLSKHGKLVSAVLGSLCGSGKGGI
ncbi:winged helix-turn-helix transcriptional regulator [Bacillus wiedmannii]|uniref:winged helix-turn-helix transcriptional regulator n=1 Tax=Bacillus wiedmannii TaxID=1890302 RepID=UPI0038577B65